MTKPTGIDGIPVKLLKASAIPREWKTARITPNFKEGDKCDVSNYRPISILLVVMKILERAIHNQL